MLLRLFSLAVLLAFAAPANAGNYVVLAPGETTSNEIWNDFAPVPGENVPKDCRVMLWIPEKDESGKYDTDVSHYADMGAVKGFRRVTPVKVEAPAQPDIDGFFDAMITSGKFSQEEILQGMIASKVRDATARNTLILQFAASAPPERQADLADLAKQFNITLPLEGK